MFGRGLGDTYAVFLLPLEREFGWTRSELTSVYSIYLLVNGCTAPLVGLAFDRLGPRWVYGAGMACLGAAFFLAGGLTALWQFYVFIGVLVGIGVSLNGMVPASALLARWYRERLSTAIGVAYSAFGVGTVLFVPLVQFLVGEFDWRYTYRVMGVRCSRSSRSCFSLFPGRFSPLAKQAHPGIRRTRRPKGGRWQALCAHACSGAWCRSSASPPPACSRSWCSSSLSSSTPGSRRSRPRRPSGSWACSRRRA